LFFYLKFEFIYQPFNESSLNSVCCPYCFTLFKWDCLLWKTWRKKRNE